MALVNIVLNTLNTELNNNLTFSDGAEVYLDKHDGVMGYNASVAQCADTFVPFSKCEIKMYGLANAPSGSLIFSTR